MCKQKVDKRCKNCLYFRDDVWCSADNPGKIDLNDFCKTFMSCNHI